MVGKGTDENRLTYLLRPNVTRPDRKAPATLETPPVTDIEVSSNPGSDIDSDFVSERDLESDIEMENLPSIAEGPSTVLAEETGSCDVYDLDSGSEIGSGLEGSVDILQARLESLTVGPAPEIQPMLSTSVQCDEQPSRRDDSPNTTLPVLLPSLIDSPRSHRWTATRSPSSPSRSPMRLRRRRRLASKKRIAIGSQGPKTFYDYLFR